MKKITRKIIKVKQQAKKEREATTTQKLELVMQIVRFYFSFFFDDYYLNKNNFNCQVETSFGSLYVWIKFLSIYLLSSHRFDLLLIHL